MIHPEKEITKESVLNSLIVWEDCDINKLAAMKLFDPEDIIQLFRMSPLCELPDVFDELGKVKAKNFSVIIKEDGTYVFNFSVMLEAKVKK